MAVTLSSSDLTLRLWNAQEDSIENEVGMVESSLFSRDTDEVFLLPLTVADEQSPNGICTANRLTGQSNYSNDPLTALGQFVNRLESFVDAKQGGYSLSNDNRSRSIPCALRSASWEYRSGEPHQVEWSIECVRGRDFHFSFGSSSGPEGTNPSTSASLAGYDLGELNSYRVTREQSLSTVEIPQLDRLDVDLDDNMTMMRGSPVRRIRIEGTKIGTESELASFEEGLRGQAGNIMETVSFSEAFPGRDMQVAIADFSATRESGEVRRSHYRLELVEGIQLAGLIEKFEEFYDDLDI